MTGIYRCFTRAIRFTLTPFSRIGHPRLPCPSRRHTQPERFSLRINPDLVRRDSRVKPERRRSERFLPGLRWFSISRFLPVHPPTSSATYSFSISEKEGKKAIRTYVRTYIRSGKNNKCYGSCVAEPAPAINHVSRVLKSTSKFSFKSHAVRFIKEHY